VTSERHDSTADDPTPDATSALAADALRLIGSAQEWAKSAFAETSVDKHVEGHTGPDCQWCPLCQFVAVLRGERPELTERVAELGSALVTVLRATLDAATNAAPPGQHRAEDNRARVQHIDLGPA
jgi:hypothetical protein